jgi:RimJ/RimL family protein N-acetyltransferase
MKTIKGQIKIQDEICKYKLFDIHEIIEIIKNHNKLALSLEECIGLLRGEKNFTILNIILEDIQYHPHKVLYFMIYKGHEVIGTSRLIFNENSKTGYINMIFTNVKYKNKHVCQLNLEKIIALTKLKMYELEVDIENVSAIKCYENVGFKIIKKIKNKYNLMRIKLK